MISAVVTLTVLGLTLGFLLGFAALKLRVEKNPLLDEIIAILPGTQCGQCGFPGCEGAATALVAGQAPVTLCPPGGKSVAETLATKLGVSADLSQLGENVPRVAHVNELTCIGCIKCFRVCPTDAIVGAPKHIHGVLADACTACGKCVEVCPTESLQLIPVSVGLHNWQWPKPAQAA